MLYIKNKIETKLIDNVLLLVATEKNTELELLKWNHESWDSVRGFKLCCLTTAIDDSEDDVLWQENEETEDNFEQGVNNIVIIICLMTIYILIL